MLFRRCVMRPFLPLIVMAVAGNNAPTQDDEAEVAFRTIERQTHNAKSLQVRFRLTITDALGGKGTIKGSLILGEGDKYRIEGAGKLFGAQVNFIEVSDGMNTRLSDLTNPKENL